MENENANEVDNKNKTKIIKLICAVCNKTFIRKGHNQKYCSSACRNIFLLSKKEQYAQNRKAVVAIKYDSDKEERKEITWYECLECGKDYKNYAVQTTAYCSDICEVTAKNNNRYIKPDLGEKITYLVCPVCRKVFKVSNGKKVCSYVCRKIIKTRLSLDPTSRYNMSNI